MKALVPTLVLLTVVTAAAFAGWPDGWRNWRYGAPIVISQAPVGGLVTLMVTPSITTRARRGWSDLRVIDAQDREVPFMLLARLGSTENDHRPARILEPTHVEGSYRQVVADTGESPPIHNSLKLGITADANLLAFVEVAVSSDMNAWTVIRDRAPIYVLAKEGLGLHTDIAFPESASRYMRIRVLDGTTTYAIASIEIGYDVTIPAERVSAEAVLTPSTPTSTPRQSVWTSEGDLSAIPITAVEFVTRQQTLSRQVRIATSEDGKRWTQVSEGHIQTPAPPGRSAALVIDAFPETYARRWQITVNHMNDAPIDDLRPALLTVPRRVVFRPDAGQSYRLLFGQPRASEPGYDLSVLADAKSIAQAIPVTAGAAETNAEWIDPTPWTERYRSVLWTAMAAAAILLGVAAMRTLRGPAIAADAAPSRSRVS